MYYLFFLFSILFFNTLIAGETYGISLKNGLKYKKNALHYDYVNPTAPKGGHFHLSCLTPFDSLNPFILKGLPAPGILMVYATLLEQSEDEPASAYAYVAKSIDVSKDYKTITFQLNQDAKFSDDKPITAYDVEFSFNILREKGHPKFKQYWADVECVVVKNNHTIEFRNKNEKNKEIPFIIGQLPIFPKHHYKHKAFDQTDLTAPPVSGPYKIDEIIPGKKIVYQRIHNWWGGDLFTQKGRHNFEKVEHLIYRDDTARFEAFKSGSIDMRMETSVQNWVKQYDFKAVKDGRVQKIVLPSKFPKPTTGIVLNTRNEHLKKVKVRQALNLMFDFEWCNKNLFYGLMTRNNSYFPLSPLSSEGKKTDIISKHLKPFEAQHPKRLLESDLPVISYDNAAEKRQALKKAQALLVEAGYKIEKQKIIQAQTKKPLEFTFIVDSNRTEKVALLFAEDLKKIGISIKIMRLDRQSYIMRIQNFEFDLCFDQMFTALQQSLSPGSEFRMYFSSTNAHQKGSLNYSGIEDPVVDTFVEKIIDSPSEKDAIELTQTLDFILLHGYYRILGWHFDGLMIGVWDTIKGVEKKPPFPQFYISRFWHRDAK